MNPRESGQTTPVQGETQERAPRAPHERDESADSQQQHGEPSAQEVGELGRQDVERGVRDTTKQSELEKTYDRLSDRG
jgi:hypothetical protein